MKKITILHGSTIESALQYLKEQSKIQNEDLYANFNDKKIFSTDSIDDAYKRIVGKTKEELMLISINCVKSTTEKNKSIKITFQILPKNIDRKHEV